MKKSIKILTLSLATLISGNVFTQTISDIYKNVEFKMPAVAETSFPNTTVNIKDFGAVSGGIVKNTEAFRKAIDETSKKGGGKVVVPRGMWLTGPIVLKNNINLHLEDGALLMFSRDFNDYPLVDVSFEGLNTIRCQSPLSARGANNIAITGKGVIDGNGDAWRYVKKGKMTDGQWKELLSKGGVLSADKKIWFPSESSKKGFENTANFNIPEKLTTKAELEQVKDFLRPVMVSLVNCDKVLLDGPTFQNSPAWNIHPLMSSNLILRNITVRNPWYSQNGDGLDLESCKNVLVYNNTFDVGDDAICIKSGKDKDGRDRGIPTENVIIKNNTVYHAHGGIVIGSEMSGGVRNLHASDCTFIGTDIGLRFKTTRGRGGIVENIWMSNINMTGIPAQVIGFNMFYEGNSPIIEEDQNADDEKSVEKQMPVTEETPVFRNVFFKNITASNSYEALSLNGLSEMNLKNIVIEDSHFDTRKALTIMDADGITLKNVIIKYTDGTGATIYNSKNVDISGLTLESSKTPLVKVVGNKIKSVRLPSGLSADKLSVSKDVPKNAVK